MANEQYAFLTKSKMPSLEEWQSAVTQAGFDLQIEPSLKIGSDSGFAPCKICGTDSGVEIYFEDDPEFIQEFEDIAPGTDYCVSFRWGGDMVECACAMVLSYALAAHCGAIVSYEGDDPYEDLGAFMTDTQSILRDAKLTSGE